MLTISNYSISLTRGDSAYIELKIYNDSGVQYELQDGDAVYVQVRGMANYNGRLLFDGEVSLDIENNVILWHINPEDTLNATAGRTYYWDAQIEFENGDRFTFIPVSEFNILGQVTYTE